MSVLLDVVLALAKGVPELDGLVTRARDDLPVVGGEADGKNVVVVADEAAGGLAGGKLPEAEGLVPGGGEGVGAVRRDDLCSNCQLSYFRFLASQLLRVWVNIRSRTRCGSGRADSSWGNRTRSRRGSGSR